MTDFNNRVDRTCTKPSGLRMVNFVNLVNMYHATLPRYCEASKTRRTQDHSEHVRGGINGRARCIS
jgi:hypothetical protein